MREPPVEVDNDGVHARPRRTGHGLTDLILALAAIFISIVSLVVAVEHGQTERQLVTAGTWPFLEMQKERSGRDGQFVSKLILRNAGVGPARLVSMVIRLNGQVIHSPGEFLTACCGVPKGTTTDTRSPYGVIAEGGLLGIIEAHQGNDLLWISSKAEPIRQKFESVWPILKYEACYCSVLNECWHSDLSDTGTPSPTASCVPSKDDYHDEN